MYFLIKISICERKICIANLIGKLRSNTRHFDFAKGDRGIPRGNWNWSNDLRIRSGRQGSWTLKGVGRPRKDGTVIPSSSISPLFPHSSSISSFLLLSNYFFLLSNNNARSRSLPRSCSTERKYRMVTSASSPRRRQEEIPRRSSTLKIWLESKEWPRLTVTKADSSKLYRSFLHWNLLVITSRKHKPSQIWKSTI